MSVTIKDENSFRGLTVRVDGELAGYVAKDQRNGRTVWWARDKDGKTITYQSARKLAVQVVTDRF